jgi:hypothetical protein
VPFVPGIELSRRFYAEVVGPLLGGLPHSAALIGAGSEVLGFDTERSTDHDWGPRLIVFLRPADRQRHADELTATLADRLPHLFAGYPTRHGEPARHRVVVTDLDTWFTTHLGVDPRAGLDVLDWLVTPTQLLAEATGGAVYADGLGELIPARERLAWYPPDVWRYVLACQWWRVDQEEPFVGRTGEVGDDTGSAVLVARLVRDLMRLCLLLERRWPPYAKWLGSAFARLPAAAGLNPHLSTALTAGPGATPSADGRTAREVALGRALTVVAGLTNAVGLAEPVDVTLRPFHDRPFQVLGAARFTEALLAAVTDPAVRALPRVGAVDQFVDSTDVLGRPDSARAAALPLLGGVRR